MKRNESTTTNTIAHACSDFDRVVSDASDIQADRGLSWVDALCLAAGRGMAVVCDEEGAVDVVASAESGEAWL